VGLCGSMLKELTDISAAVGRWFLGSSSYLTCNKTANSDIELTYLIRNKVILPKMGIDMVAKISPENSESCGMTSKDIRS